MEKEKMSREQTEIMSLEKADHFLRHIKMHADEVKSGTFNKDKEDYLNKLRKAQRVALEISHDIIYILRRREFKGYENADFSFNVDLPKDWENHEFRIFDCQSFRVGCKLGKALELGIDEMNIKIELKDLEEQMQALGDAIQDSEVLIKMLE